jgi:hypothetical protein
MSPLSPGVRENEGCRQRPAAALGALRGLSAERTLIGCDGVGDLQGHGDRDLLLGVLDR